MVWGSGVRGEFVLVEYVGVRFKRDWYFIAEKPAPAPHLAHPEGCAALRIVPGQTTGCHSADGPHSDEQFWGGGEIWAGGVLF